MSDRNVKRVLLFINGKRCRKSSVICSFTHLHERKCCRHFAMFLSRNWSIILSVHNFLIDTLLKSSMPRNCNIEFKWIERPLQTIFLSRNCDLNFSVHNPMIDTFSILQLQLRKKRMNLFSSCIVHVSSGVTKNVYRVKH